MAGGGSVVGWEVVVWRVAGVWWDGVPPLPQKKCGDFDIMFMQKSYRRSMLPYFCTDDSIHGVQVPGV